MPRANGFPRYPLQLDRRMLPADAFFWYAEAATPEMRPLVAGLFLLDRAPDRERFTASVKRLIACVPRFRQRVVARPLSLALPEWHEDPLFDLRYHLRELALPQPAREDDLYALAGSLFATPLDHARPLWEGYLFTGLPDGRAAYLLKMHHSLMDGAGSVALFDAMTQAGPEDAVPPPPRRRTRAAPVRVNGADWWSSLDSAARAGAGLAAELVRRASTEDALDQGRRALRRLGAVLDDLRSPPARDPLIAATTGVGRRLAGAALPLARLRALKESLAVSLNDVVLLAVAGALSNYHRERGLALGSVPCVVPMSLREEQDRHRLGNRVGAFRVALPLDEPDVGSRLERIHTQTRAAKETRQGSAYAALMGLVGLVPAALWRALARQANGRVHLICSNVPGPPVSRYLGGARIEAVLPFAPVMFGTPLSIALMSYGDRLGFGIDSDPAAIPDPARIRRHVEAEIETLERHARGRRRDPRRNAQEVGSGSKVSRSASAGLRSL